jgi:hypothetical protein
MNSKLIHASSVALAALLGTTGCADDVDATANPGYVLLDDSARDLRADFNDAKGTVRVLFVVDPICPGCLRGLDDVNRDLLAKTDDPNLRTFVVHVPVLGAEAKDIPPAARLLENSLVRHYWNPSGAFGRQLAEAVDLRRDNELVYAWDVWLIYGPEATWNEELPPKPLRLMHQLRALQGSADFPHLDSDVFAREVRALLERHSSGSPTR